ncbi:MAG: hypothetical protein WC314_26010 [Vulcanimicrobiota bacterium]
MRACIRQQNFHLVYWKSRGDDSPLDLLEFGVASPSRKKLESAIVPELGSLVWRGEPLEQVCV